MSQPNKTNLTDDGAQKIAKKPYHKPEVRCERVFETRALTCGKTSPTQGQCMFNLSSS